PARRCAPTSPMRLPARGRCFATAIRTWAAPRSCRPGAMRWRKRHLSRIRVASGHYQNAVRGTVRSPDGAKRNPGRAVPHCAALHAGYDPRHPFRIRPATPPVPAQIWAQKAPLTAGGRSTSYVNVINIHGANQHRGRDMTTIANAEVKLDQWG